MFGTVGAAAASAYAHALADDGYSTALRLAANYSFGTVEGFSEGSDEPFLQAGVAAALGLLATRLASAGAFASRGTFDGPNGFLRAFADVTGDVEVARAWRIMDVSCKAYPISAGKLSSMDTAVAFAARGIASERIAAVVADVPESAVRFPGSDRRGEFANYTQAQDSTPFCIAAAICGRAVAELSTYLDGYGDAEVAEFTRRITLRGVAGRELTKLTVTLTDGEVIEAEVDARDNRIPSVAAMSDKLRRLGEPVWGADRCERIVELVTGDPAARVSELSAVLRDGHSDPYTPIRRIRS
jgi:2-methylcitrate dehydratase PrpD